jgi:putative ABC transport system permease protein
VLWMSEKALAAIFDLDGAFNSVTLQLSPSTDERAAIQAVDHILTPFGGAGAYGRSDHISHEFLDAELQQLSALSRVIPPIFLFVSAFLLNMTLSRLIALEREQIGLLKALGYSGTAVALHYVKMVLLIAIAGTLIGYAVGTWFGTNLTTMYGRFFQFPFLIFRRDPDVYLLAAAIACAAALAGAINAVLRVVNLPPAVAMQPPAPPRFRRGLIEWTGIARISSQMTVISLRNMLRRPLRAATTMLGVSLAAALLIVSFFAFDSVDHLIDVTFFLAERQQASINFTDKRPMRVIEAAARLPGVMRVEPYRSVPVRLRNGWLSRKVALTGKPIERELSRVLNLDLHPVPLPEAGLVINRRVAQILNLRRGDKVEIELLEGRRGVKEAVVSDVIESYFGLVVNMDLAALNELLDDPPLVSGVHISYDTKDEPALFKAIKATPAATSIALQRTALRRFRETLAENINMMTSVYITLSVIVAFGVVYNSARIQLSERGRELASLRVLGFTNGEVSRVLLVELAILVAAAQPLGWLLGYIFGWLTIQGFSSDLYTTPLIIKQATYAKASLVVVGASVVSALLVRRRVDTLDLIEVLKTRE